MKKLIVLLILLFPFTALAADEWTRSDMAIHTWH
jgi:hypothetical protein